MKIPIAYNEDSIDCEMISKVKVIEDDKNGTYYHILELKPLTFYYSIKRRI